MRWALIAAFVSANAFWAAGQAHAFGAINAMGQNAEHEKITRRALDCAQTRNCLQARTLDELAGKTGTFGAVGS